MLFIFLDPSFYKASCIKCHVFSLSFMTRVLLNISEKNTRDWLVLKDKVLFSQLWLSITQIICFPFTSQLFKTNPNLSISMFLERNTNSPFTRWKKMDFWCQSTWKANSIMKLSICLVEKSIIFSMRGLVRWLCHQKRKSTMADGINLLLGGTEEVVMMNFFTPLSHWP